MVAKKKQRPKRQKASPRAIKAADHSEQSLRLRREGKTFSAIGTTLGLTTEGARKAVYRALHAIVESTEESAKDLRELESQRLDEMIRALWPKVKKGEIGAIDIAVKIIARRAKLFGLDEPKKNEHTGKDGKPIEVAVNTWLDLVKSAASKG